MMETADARPVPSRAGSSVPKLTGCGDRSGKSVPILSSGYVDHSPHRLGCPQNSFAVKVSICRQVAQCARDGTLKVNICCAAKKHIMRVEESPQLKVYTVKTGNYRFKRSIENFGFLSAIDAGQHKAERNLWELC